MDHHVHVEPMDVDCMDSDFDNKENSYQHSNVLPCTEKGYEELDVSELNMKLRYSVTPAASPMSKSYSAYVDKILEDDSVNCNETPNLTRSLNSTMTNNDSVIKSIKNLPLQTISTEQFVDNRNLVLRPLKDSSVDNVTITISGANDIDENVSLPSLSSSAIHTPEATTPTNISKNEEGSPIIRGLKSVFNMFRSSQSPIPPIENDNLVKQEVSPLDETYCEDQNLQTLASTPISAHRSRDGSTSKRSSPLKDSIVFSDDLEKELQWKEDTILFSEEKIPIHKLFLPLAKPMPTVSATSHKDKKTAADLNSTVEDMDVSYNNFVMLDNTMTEMLDNTNAVESDGEFVDCETTITKNESLCVKSQVETEKALMSSALEILDVTKEIGKQNEYKVIENVDKIENETHKKLEHAPKTLDITGVIIVNDSPAETENEEHKEKMPLTDGDMTLDVTRDNMVSALTENIVLSDNATQREPESGAQNVLDITREIENGNVTDVNENQGCVTVEIEKEPSENTSQRNYVTLENFGEKDIAVTGCDLPVAIVPIAEIEAAKCDVPTLLRSVETSTEIKLDIKAGNKTDNDTPQSVESISLQEHETETVVIKSLNVSKENKAERTFEVCKEVTCLTKDEIDMIPSVEIENTIVRVMEHTQNLSNEPPIDSVQNIETNVVSDVKELNNATKDLEEVKTNLNIESNVDSHGKEHHNATKDLEEVETNLDSNADNSQLNILECPHTDEAEKAFQVSLEDSGKIEENMLFVNDYAAEPKETHNENNINASKSLLADEPANISLKTSGRVIEPTKNLSNEPPIDSVQNIETNVVSDVKELNNATKDLEEVKTNLNIESNVDSHGKEHHNATKDLEEVETNLDSNADNSQLNILECPHTDEAEKAFQVSLEDSGKIEENMLFVNDYAAEPKETHNENNINASKSLLADEPANISLKTSGRVIEPTQNLSNEPPIDSVQNIETNVVSDVKELNNATKDLEEVKTNLNIESNVDSHGKEHHNATKDLEEVETNLDSNTDNLKLNIPECPHKDDAEKAFKASLEDSGKIEENMLFVNDYAAEPKETYNENNINASKSLLTEEPANISLKTSGRVIEPTQNLSNEPQIDSVQNIETNVVSDIKELNKITKDLEEVETNLDSNADNFKLNIPKCPHKDDAEKAFKASLEKSGKIEENTLFVNDYAAELKESHNENNINALNSLLAEEPANISLPYEGFEMGPVLLLNKDKMGTTQSITPNMLDSVKIDSNLAVTETLGKTLNDNNIIGELEVLPLPEKHVVLNDTIDIVNSLTDIIGESPNNTLSIDIPHTTTANETPSSPPIRSKGYNFNFDEMDDPFARKTKIKLSPPPTPTKAEKHESKIKKEPEISKKGVTNRRRSQDPERKRPVSKKKFNTTVDTISTNKSNIPNAECASNNVSVDILKNTLVKKDVDDVDEKEQVLDKMVEEHIDAILENDLPNVQLEKKVTPAADSTIEISFENKSSIESMTRTTSEIKTSSSEHSTYYSAAASSSDNSLSKNVFNLPEIDDKNFNPFASKSKMRQSPPLCFENETSFASKNKMRSSPNSSMTVLPIAEYTQLSTQNIKPDAEDKMDTELMEKDNFYNISNTTPTARVTDDKNITTHEVNTEDEDTEEGPFLEAEDVIDKLLDMDDDNMMQFNEIPAQANEENVDSGELFIDAEAFEFLLNKNKSNIVSDSGKESLFLKFDPLFAKTISSGGVLAALNNVQKRQSTPSKPARPSLRNEASPIAGPSTLNTTYEGESNVTQDSIEDLNITVAKPMMVVTPAVNPAITPRNKTTTPPRSNRRSITFTSPAMAVIDRLLSLSGNNSLMGHDTTITQTNREHTEADVALTQLRELLAEKEISVYQLRSESKELKDRLSTMETQMKILEADGQERLNKINDLNDRLAEKTKVNKSMAAVVEEYERTIASLIAETEQDRKRHAEERVRLINERDEQTAHLASMEVSFSDLHSKYEKSKQVILSCKANEDTCKKSIIDFEANLTKMQTNYEMLKQHATSKLNHANQELQKMNKTHESEVLKLNALIKRKDMHITSLEETLAQKTKANEDLTAICDELINKVG